MLSALIRTSGLAVAAAAVLAYPSLAVSQGASRTSAYELWLADQSDTRPGHGGQILIFAGQDLDGRTPSTAKPQERIDLGAATAELCQSATGRLPVRPHMVLFNTEQSHAIVSFVASGHVVVFDAERRAPISCLETTVSASTKTRQAHAAYPAPDGSYILVANQNGKRLERIDADFRANRYVHNATATLDLATCTTPSGRPCEDQELRPINWPICPIIEAGSRYAYVTLRGGGLFIVDTKVTPMAIVAEYDKATVHGNGCGGVQVGSAMYLNSGGSPVNVSSTDPHHEALYGFDVYRFSTSGFRSGAAPNTPAPQRLFTKAGAADSHGLAATGGNRYLWVMDRHGDVAEVLEVRTGRHVRTVPLNGPLTSNAAPDLVDVNPRGDLLFVAFRGPVPLSGDPHNAVGSTPGLGIVRLASGGASGVLDGIVPVTNPGLQPGQQPDPHGLRVRRLR